jgi:hypothetical protein
MRGRYVSRRISVMPTTEQKRPETTIRKKRPSSLVDRFLSKFEKTDHCWLWEGGINEWGYGQFWVGGTRKKMAHRVSYELYIGPIPEGLTIDHLCRVPACVNPAHMEVVTVAENILRGTGPSANYARRTHCENGHPFVAGNVRHRGGSNGRRCVTCEHARDVARKKPWRRP